MESNGENSTQHAMVYTQNIHVVSISNSEVSENIQVRDDDIDYITPGIVFQLTEVGARFYPEWNVLIRAPAVTLLSAYMRTPIYLTRLFDSKFVYFLVLEVLGKENIMESNYDKSKLDFARLIYQNRVANDKTRLDMFYHYVNKKINDIRAKYNAVRDTGNSIQSLFTKNFNF